jgi:hypothetical protein
MPKGRIIALPAMVIGAALVGYGLFGRLYTIPVVGDIRYSEQHLGGSGQAWTIIVLMLLTAALSAGGGCLRRLGMLFAGGGLGALIASLLAIYRATMDQLDQLGPEALELLAKRQAMAGLWALAIGLVLWILGLIYCLVERDSRPSN